MGGSSSISVGTGSRGTYMEVNSGTNTTSTASADSATAKPLTATQGFDPNQWASQLPNAIKPDNNERTAAPLVVSSCGEGVCAALWHYDGKWNVLVTALLLVLPLVLLVFAGVIAALIALAVIYIVYSIEVCASPTYKYLSNVRDIDQIYGEFDALRCKMPKFWWTVQNWHYATTMVRNNNGTFKSERKRVDTMRREGHFVFNVWRDASPQYPDFTEFALTKMKVKVKAQFADDFTSAECQRQREYFFAANSSDHRQDKSEGVSVDGMVQEILVEAEPSRRPTCLSLHCFRLTSLLGFSCCFRLWLESNTGRVKFKLRKQVFAVPNLAPGDKVPVLSATRPVKYKPPKNATQAADKSGVDLVVESK